MAGSILVFSSCYSPGRTLTPAMAEAMTYTEEGASAFRVGQYGLAQQRYKAALDLHIGAGNSPGIIRNLINLAVVQHAAGQNKSAWQSMAALDRHRVTHHQSVDSETRVLFAEAAWLKAHICIDEGRLEDAGLELDRAGAQLGASRSSRLHNVRARLLLEQKRPAEASEAAKRAWSASKRSRDAMEQADAARYQARSMEQLGQHAKAAEWYRVAQSLDQSLSRQHLVSDDFLGQARAAKNAGNVEEARNLAILALDAGKRSQDRGRESQAQKFIRSLRR